MSARLFAALELPADVRAGLVAFGREAAAHDRALRPAREDALHLTLAFLGHRALDEVDPAREAVRSVAGSPAPVLSLADPLSRRIARARARRCANCTVSLPLEVKATRSAQGTIS